MPDPSTDNGRDMSQADQGPKDNIVLAVAVIVATVFALALGDAVIKRVSAGFPLWQIFVLRSLIAVPVLFGAIRFARSRPTPMPKVPLWTAVRSLMLVAMWVAYYASLPHVPLASAAAVYYTLPLFITLFASVFLNERVGLRGWLAIAAGFAGVLLILRPDAGDFNAFALLPLAAAVLYAGAMILTRSKCRNEHPLVLSLALNVSFVAVGGAASLAFGSAAPNAEAGFLSAPWVSLGLEEWGVMALLAASILIGSIGAAIAYQSGPASVVATFDFAYLAFATFWGFALFAEVPSAPAIAGIVLIAAAGISAVRR